MIRDMEIILQMLRGWPRPGTLEKEQGAQHKYGE